ncbi:LysR family transcriptional regulator [Methylocella sp.]|uniref:LysR family transcriptional regulator n=1 Tax=Methylocella sp. TaxID=1978226 RepID=UPI0037850598
MHSIRQIHVVRALAEHRHFGRAARALGVSQPNLTRTLKQMEDALGVSLFDRQGVTPTLFGEIILRHGERAIADFGELMREVDLAKGLEVGELRIVAGPYAADISGARAVAVLLRKHPKLVVEIRNATWENAVHEVGAGGADIAFAETGEVGPELEAQRIRVSRMAFFCAADHPLARKKNLTLEDLMDFPWAGPSLPERMSASLPKVDRPFATFNEAVNRFQPRALVGSFAIAKQIVLNGEALGAAIPSQIERELRDGLCVTLPVEAPWLTIGYGFVFKRGRMLSPAASAYMQIVREIEAEIPD